MENNSCKIDIQIDNGSVVRTDASGDYSTAVAGLMSTLVLLVETNSTSRKDCERRFSKLHEALNIYQQDVIHRQWDYTQFSKNKEDK